MVVKKDDEFDSDDEEDDKKPFSIGLSTIITGIVFLVIVQIFFFLLSTKTTAAFGLKQILFGIALAVVITLFLLWMKYIMRSNRYLGLIIGILVSGAMWYAISQKYQGPYTTTFMIISILVGFVYLFIQFFKSKN